MKDFILWIFVMILLFLGPGYDVIMNAECKKLAKYVEDFINAANQLWNRGSDYAKGYHCGVLMLAEKVFNIQLNMSTGKYIVLDMKSSLISQFLDV